MLEKLPEKRADQALIVYSKDPLGHWKGIDFHPVDTQDTIQNRLEEMGIWEDFTTFPLFCTHNGKPIMRAEYETITLCPDDVLIIHNQPYGGGQGGSDPIRTVLQIAVVVAAMYTGQVWLADAAWAVQAAGTAAVMIGGTMLVDLIRPVTTNESFDEQSPTYSLRADGNQARLGQSIPVRYGKHLTYPDFASLPYSEYTSEALNSPDYEVSLNPHEDGYMVDEAYIRTILDGHSFNAGEPRQILNLLYCVGQGEYDLSDLKLGDTPITNFEDVEYEVINPGDPVTLFPTNVDVSGDISGQELTQNTLVGHFVLGSVGEKIESIHLDISFPAGLARLRTKGDKQRITADFNISIKEINDAGANTGNNVNIPYSVSAGVTRPLYRTVRITGDQLPGVNFERYEVAVTKTSTDSADKIVAASYWIGLRAHTKEDTPTFQGLTLVAVRMVAGEEVSSLASRKFNCIFERKLKQYNGTGFDVAATLTRDVGQAIIDMARSDYGLNLNDNQIDLAGIKALDDAAHPNDQFDYSFETESGSWDALRLAAAVIHAEPIIQNGVLRIVQDVQKFVSVAAFTSDNILPNSLSTEYLIPNTQTADYVIVEYIDETVGYEVKTVNCKLTGYPATVPVTIRLNGQVNRARAHKWGLRKARSNFLRRRFMTFTTTGEGFIPEKFDVVDVNSPEIDQYMTSGVIMDLETTIFVDDTLVLSTQDVVDPTPSDYFLALRDDQGQLGTLYEMVWVDEQRVRFLSDPGGSVIADISSFLEVGQDRQPTFFAMGKGSYHRRRAKVLTVRPISYEEVEITTVVEDDEVYNESGEPVTPDLPDYYLDAPTTAPGPPTVSHRILGTPDQQVIELTWPHVQYAERYLIQVSFDAGSNWRKAGNVSNGEFRFPYTGDDLPIKMRVASVGVTRGTWSNVIDITSNMIPTAFNVEDSTFVFGENGPNLRLKWQTPSPNLGFRVEVYWPATTNNPSIGLLKRTVDVPYGERFIVYSYLDAIEDDPDGTGGVNSIKDGARDVVFKVYGRINGNPGDPDDFISDVPAVFVVNDPLNLPLNNPQYGAIVSPNINVTLAVVELTWTIPEDEDIAGIDVYVSKTPGFTPGVGNFLRRYYTRTGSQNVGGELDENTRYYIRWGGFDYWGDDGMTYSPEIDITTTGPAQAIGHFSDTAPAIDTPYPHSVADIWFDTSNNNNQHRWNETTDSWDDIQDSSWTYALLAGNDPVASLDGITHLLLQDTEPAETDLINYGLGDRFSEGDVWIDTNFGNLQYRWDDTLNQWDFVKESAESQSVYIQNDAPPTVGLLQGDAWFDSNADFRQFVYYNQTWQPVSTGTGDTPTPIFLVFTGQSNATGVVAASGMVKNDNVFEWTTGGSGSVYDWESPDPNATERADFVNAVIYTGMRLGGYGNIGWAAADAIQKATGSTVYMVTTHRSGAPIAEWLGTEALKVMLDTQVAAALSSTELTAAGVTEADCVVWMQGEADNSRTDDNYLSDLQTVIDNSVTDSWTVDNKTKWLFCELSYQHITNQNKNAAFHIYDNTSNEFYRVISSRGRDSVDGVHFNGASLVGLGVASAASFLSGQIPKTPYEPVGQQVMTRNYSEQAAVTGAKDEYTLSVGSTNQKHLLLSNSTADTTWAFGVEEGTDGSMSIASATGTGRISAGLTIVEVFGLVQEGGGIGNARFNESWICDDSQTPAISWRFLLSTNDLVLEQNNGTGGKFGMGFIILEPATGIVNCFGLIQDGGGGGQIKTENIRVSNSPDGSPAATSEFDIKIDTGNLSLDQFTGTGGLVAFGSLASIAVDTGILSCIGIEQNGGNIQSDGVNPQTNGVGSVGDTGNRWASGWFNTIYENGVDISTVYLTSADLSGYLPLSGGTITGNITNGSTMTIDPTTGTVTAYKFESNGVNAVFHQGVVPNTNNTGTVGTNLKRWNTLYATTIYEGGTALSAKYSLDGHTHTDYLATTGGTLTGDLTIDTTLHVAFIREAGGNIGIGQFASIGDANGILTCVGIEQSGGNIQSDGVNPQTNGVGSVGDTGNRWASGWFNTIYENGVDISTVYLTSADLSGYLPLSGGTITGNITNGSTMVIAPSTGTVTAYKFTCNGVNAVFHQGVVPNTNNTGTVGTNLKRWNTIYATTIYEGGTALSSKYNNYQHPTTAGNKHIPSGGSADQILEWSSSGTAVWADPAPADLSGYLPLSGGTITGNITNGSTMIIAPSTGVITAYKIEGNGVNAVFHQGVVPNTTNTGSCGTNTKRWNIVHGTTIYEAGVSLATKYAAASHTHSYLPLTGGTVTGNTRINSLGVGTTANGTAGYIRATNNIVAYYSDERLKDIKCELDPLDCLAHVNSWRAVRYTAKDWTPFDSEIEEVGVLAQDIEKTTPEAVHPAPFDEKYNTVQYERLIPDLIGAIQALTEKVESLQDEIDELKKV